MPLTPGRIVDLTLDVFPGAPVYPGDPSCRFRRHDTIASTGYNMTEIFLGTHQGTHLDAPFHFFDRGQTVDQLALDRCVGPATMIDLSSKPPRHPITLADFQPYASIVQPGARVIYRLGWDRRIADPGYFEDYPSMTLELAEWLATRRIALIGMDSPGPSVAQWNEVHRALLGADVVIVEGLAHLDQLPTDRPFFFVAAPLRLRGLDGSPVRAFALVE